MRSAVLLVAAVLSASHSRIVEVVGESGDAGPSPRLVVMDADGSHARLRLNWVTGASLDPHARFVAYAPRTSTLEIWVVALDARGRGRRVVTNGYEPDWSPTGSSLAFTRDAPRRQAGVWTADLRGRKQRLVLRGAGQPNWSPNGTKLAAVRGGDIWVVDTASGSARRLIRNGYWPRWSPDGRRLAFVRDNGMTTAIYVANADGSAQRRVAEGEAPAWSPDGSELAACDFTRVVRMRPDGTHRRVVYRGAPGCEGLDWG
jgi:dipeptidyl aminopeptidase/acylaminoacyl peptidase